jgi:hypothetical protein
VTVAVLARSLHELLDLGVGQILSGSRFHVGPALGRATVGLHCPNNSGRPDQRQA